MRSASVVALVTAGMLIQPPPKPPAVTVDREVHVSASEAALKMGETVLAAHPTDPNRLVGAGVAWLNGAGRRAVVVYTSRDGGVSWAKTLSTADKFFDAADEAVAFGPDGTAYLVLLGSVRDERANLVVYRSDDGGSTWTLASHTRTGTSYDRPYVTVQPDGTVWIGAAGLLPRPGQMSLAGPAIFTSANRGQTLTLIGIRPSPPPARLYFSGNLVLTSDGIGVSVFPEADDATMLGIENPQWGTVLYPERVLGSIQTMRITPLPRLEPFVAAGRALHPLRPGEYGPPILAVDSSGQMYHDRLYVVWPDRRSGHVRISSAFSTDKGSSWSSPRAVDDSPDATDPQPDPNNFMPSVAVNRNGVIGATWYDRREDSANLGWRVRFAASFDGAQTWRPSAPVSSHRNVYDEDGMFSTTLYGPVLEVNIDDRQLYAGDTAGLAAAADGSFHAFWIDNRTSIPQLWSARIRVVGAATRNGTPELDALTDVSAEARVGFDRASYREGVVRAAITVTNTSKRTFRAPAKLRAIVVESVVGIPELLGTDNGEKGVGAIWDLSSYFPDAGLEPGATSKPLSISCRLRSRKPIADGLLLRAGLLRLETQVLAKMP